MISEFAKISNMISHPVHIEDTHGNLMPSAFIPFCSFGSDTGALGKNVSGFSKPVCNKFTQKTMQGQVCYQLDLQDVKDKVAFRKGEMNGLTFVMDYNKDKMVNNPFVKPDMKDVEGRLSKEEATIYVDTLGKYKHDYLHQSKISGLSQEELIGKFPAPLLTLTEVG